MSLTCKLVTFDCSDPQQLARFWADATGGELESDWGDYVLVRTESLGIPHLGFQRVPEGKVAKNRCHLDLATSDRDAEVRRLVGLGGLAGDEHSGGPLRWTQMRDPEGNEFCVAEA